MATRCGSKGKTWALGGQDLFRPRWNWPSEGPRLIIRRATIDVPIELVGYVAGLLPADS
jgi:hypothetical protein